MRVEESQLEDVTAPAKGIVVRRSWQKHVLTFLMVFGPGMIAWLAHPDWGAVARNTLVPSLPSGSLVFLIIAIVGTTIAPWQLFFQQSCVAEKKLRFSDLPEFAFVTRSAVAASLHLFEAHRTA